MNGVIKRSDPADDYELFQKVGHGTYGEVYKAKHVRSGEMAAVKVVKLEAGDNFTAIQQEILVLMDCKHPNIISYYGSYLRRDKLWIVMEYCSGGSLQDIYQMIGPLTELQIAFVCRETLKGLKYLHQLGKIHRDVKGANILLTHSGDIKLADFGVAAQITATIGKRKSFIGTPYWMAPEVANVEQRGGYGVECDVWAVGITAIELAELQPPLFDLHPMQVLYLMTKSSYKPPKLKDKKKWSSTFHDFVKSCLTKNPKKRPSPAKLLSSHSFVVGALSSRLTRELLDRVNNPGGALDESRQSANVSSDLEITTNADFTQNIILKKRDEKESARLRSYHEDGTLRVKGDSPTSAADEIKYAVPFADADEDDEDENDDDNEDDENVTGRENRGKMPTNHLGNGQQKSDARPRPMSMFGESANLPAEQIPSVSRPPLSTAKSPSNRPGERSMSLGAAYCATSALFQSAHNNNNNFGAAFVKKRRNFQSVGCGGIGEPRDGGKMRPLAARPQTIFGLVPTPQVSMGACFCNILHNCTQQVNWCATWTHPASHKQYLIVGAEEGIFTLDLCELHNNSLTLIHERKCTWLCVIGDVMIAQQGKTPYLYRHDILQLMQQQLITQKITKTMTRIPEKYKPRVLLTTIRMPETRDCFKCCVERSVTNGNIYMGCAVPDAVLLFQWYEPLSRFIMMKRVDVDFGAGAKAILRSSPSFFAPFSLVFGSCASNSDFPLICTGVCRTDDSAADDRRSEPINEAPTSKQETADQSAGARRKSSKAGGKKAKLRLNFVDFNDTGKLEHFLARSPADIFAPPSLTERNGAPADDATLRPFGRNRGAFNWQDESRVDVVCLKQLDRETLFIAFEDKILLTDLEGNEKVTDLMKTSFTFDFNLNFAVPLPDSVLAFHKHGVQGRSFFRGFITQDLYDTSKSYKVIGNDSLITLRCGPTALLGSNLTLDAILPPISSSNAAGGGGKTSQNGQSNTTQASSCDLCILTGHISTLTPP